MIVPIKKDFTCNIGDLFIARHDIKNEISINSNVDNSIIYKKYTIVRVTDYISVLDENTGEIETFVELVNNEYPDDADNKYHRFLYDKMHNDFYRFINILSGEKSLDVDSLYFSLKELLNNGDSRENVLFVLFKMLNCYLSEVMIHHIQTLAYAQEVWYHAILKIKKEFKDKAIVDISANTFRVYTCALLVNAKNTDNAQIDQIEKQTGWNCENMAKENVSKDIGEIILRGICIRHGLLDEEESSSDTAL